MLRNRFLILLGVTFLAASAGWADEVGYLDCSNHSEGTQVFGKPRKTPEVVASLPCGERFTILVYGFYFSRIQTKDGQIGYIYSSLIAVDRSATAAQQTPSMQMAAEKSKIPSTRATDLKPNPRTPSLTSAAPRSVSAEPATVTASVPETASAASVSSPSPSSAPEATRTVSQPDPPAPAKVQPAAAQPEPAPAQPSTGLSPEIAAPAPTSNPPVTPRPVAQPDPATTVTQPDPPSPAPAQPAPAQPLPPPAQPAAPAIRPADTQATWERPLPSVRRSPLIELYGGYAFARLVSGGSSTNFNGALGSFGWNIKPWLQIIGDTSYSFVTVSGTKNVLYGNHYGPRYYYHARNRWSITPFAEALVGGSRADTTVSGSGGYTRSQNSLSFKVGGGVDFRPSRRCEIRLFDIDYYRTSFGTNAHQNNYWASTGIVLRLFGGRSD
jgi:hypothetical protein